MALIYIIIEMGDEGGRGTTKVQQLEGGAVSLESWGPESLTLPVERKAGLETQLLCR